MEDGQGVDEIAVMIETGDRQTGVFGNSRAVVIRLSSGCRSLLAHARTWVPTARWLFGDVETGARRCGRHARMGP